MMLNSNGSFDLDRMKSALNGDSFMLPKGTRDERRAALTCMQIELERVRKFGTKEESIDTLKKIGIFNKEGKLSSKYGGEDNNVEHE